MSAGVPALAEMGPLLRESIRRARDVERTSALLPDVIPLESSGDAPSTVPDEPDYQLVVTLWEKACNKVTVAQMEDELTVDAYRIRHALAHWLQEGALRLMASATPEPPPAPAGVRDRHMSVMSSWGRAVPQKRSTSATIPSMSARPGSEPPAPQVGLEPHVAVLLVSRVGGLGDAVGVHHAGGRRGRG